MASNAMLVARKASGRVAKCIFDQIKANLAEIQPKNHLNVQKTHFLQKAPGVNGFWTTWPNFSKDGSCCDKFGKSIETKPKNARNSAKFGFLFFLLTNWLLCQNVQKTHFLQKAPEVNKLSFFVSTLSIMVPGSCHPQGCHGYLMHSAQIAREYTILLGTIPQDDIFSKTWELWNLVQGWHNDSYSLWLDSILITSIAFLHILINSVWLSKILGVSMWKWVLASEPKVIPLKLFYYQTCFETWRNEHSWY